MTEGRLAPEEVRTRTFTRVVRGYRRREVRRLLERGLPINAPVIETNGTRIYDFQAGRELYAAALDPSILPIVERLLAEHPDHVEPGLRLVRREYPTAIGPVDIMAKDAHGVSVAVELKRVGDIDGVEQLTRYLELLNRDPLLAPVQGVFAAQTIKPQARTLAEDRGIRCVSLDYDAMRGVDDSADRLF